MYVTLYLLLVWCEEDEVCGLHAGSHFAAGWLLAHHFEVGRVLVRDLEVTCNLHVQATNVAVYIHQPTVHVQATNVAVYIHQPTVHVQATNVAVYIHQPTVHVQATNVAVYIHQPTVHVQATNVAVYIHQHDKINEPQLP